MNSRIRSFLALLVSAVMLSALASGARAVEWPVAGGAAGETAPEAVADEGSEAIAARRVELEEEIAALRAQLLTGGATSVQLAERIDLLRATEGTLAMALEARRELERPADSAPPLAPARGATIEALRTAHAELDADRSRVSDLELALQASRESLSAATTSLADEERERRRLQRAFKQAPGEDLEQALELSRLRTRAARESQVLRRIELEVQRRALDLHLRRKAELEREVARLHEALRTADPSLDAPRPGLDHALAELESRRQALRLRAETATARLAEIESSGKSGNAKSPTLIEERSVLRMQRDAARTELAALAEREPRLRQGEALLQRWLAVIREQAPSAELRDWEDAAQAAAETNERSLVQRQGRLAELEERLDDVDARLPLAVDEESRLALEERRDELSRLIGFLRGDAREITDQQRLAELLLAEIRSRSRGAEVVERIATLPADGLRIWRYELTSVDDEPITVGNAVLALVLLVLGFTVSRRLSAWIRVLAESRLQLEAGVAGAIQTGTFYLLLICFTLIALRSVNFPLTAFTFAGGALAIGIGFGSQNVMNNFISGVILMLERPVRAHDLVELEGTHGSIEQIGARSTRIRATDGRHIIVPNSFFLENNVVNWTLSDELIRTRVRVGVVYGSPTRLAIELIAKVLAENDRILEHPKPIINFADFGASSLDFEAHFWLKARAPMTVRQVESNVRLRIDDLFREHGLVIAFPQRDVHLDSVSPIEVRLVDGKGAVS